MKLHSRYKFSETDYKILNIIFSILEMKHIYVQDIRRRKSIKKKQDTDARGIISRIIMMVSLYIVQYFGYMSFLQQAEINLDILCQSV